MQGLQAEREVSTTFVSTVHLKLYLALLDARTLQKSAEIVLPILGAT